MSTIDYPGHTAAMSDQPADEMRDYVGRGLLSGRRALITGGDSGIGRAVAAAFAKEGADVAIAYLTEHDDAAYTVGLIEQEGRRAVSLSGDLAEPGHCRTVVADAAEALGGLDLLVNNVAFQNPVDDFAELSDEQWRRTFAVNVDSFFHVTKAALAHLPRGASIVNTASINGLRGNKTLIDYSATKGAVIALTYSLAQSLQERRNQSELRCARTRLDTADTGDDAVGEGRVLRSAGADGARGAARRDRPVLRVLRGIPAVLVLQR